MSNLSKHLHQQSGKLPAAKPASKGNGAGAVSNDEDSGDEESNLDKGSNRGEGSVTGSLPGDGSDGNGGGTGDEDDEDDKTDTDEDDDSESDDGDGVVVLRGAVVNDMTIGALVYIARKGIPAERGKATHRPNDGDQYHSRYRCVSNVDNKEMMKRIENIFVADYSGAQEGGRAARPNGADSKRDTQDAAEQTKQRNAKLLAAGVEKRRTAAAEQALREVQRLKQQVARLSARPPAAPPAFGGDEYGNVLNNAQPQLNSPAATDLTRHPNYIEIQTVGAHCDQALQFGFTDIAMIKFDAGDAVFGFKGRMPGITKNWKCENGADMLAFAATTFTLRSDGSPHMLRAVLPFMHFSANAKKSTQQSGSLQTGHLLEEGGVLVEPRKTARENGRKLRFKPIDIEPLLTAVFKDKVASFHLLSTVIKPAVRALQQQHKASILSRGFRGDVEEETSYLVMAQELDALSFIVEQAAEMDEISMRNTGKSNVYTKTGVVQQYLRYGIRCIQWLDGDINHGSHTDARNIAFMGWFILLQRCGFMLHEGTHVFDAHATMRATRGAGAERKLVLSPAPCGDITATTRGIQQHHSKPRLPAVTKDLLRAIRSGQGMAGDSVEWTELSDAIDLRISQSGGLGGLPAVWASLDQGLPRATFNRAWNDSVLTYSEAFRTEAEAMLDMEFTAPAAALAAPVVAKASASAPIEGQLGSYDEYAGRTVLWRPEAAAALLTSKPRAVTRAAAPLSQLPFRVAELVHGFR
jgi:hypothetical protein